jgi:carbamoyltransferase
MTQRILGLGGSNHDFSVALVADGRLTFAVEEERLQRIRHAEAEWHSERARTALEYCCQVNGLKPADIEQVFVNADIDGQGFPSAWTSKVRPVGHHCAHAAASFFTSPVQKAALLVIDGCGAPIGDGPKGQKLETISTGNADSHSFTLNPLQGGSRRLTSTNWTYRVENSLGTFYELVTEAIGFGEFGEGKTMGLAAYGSESYVGEMREFVTMGGEQGFSFDPYGGIYPWLKAKLVQGQNPFRTRACIAKAVQTVFEEAVVSLARNLQATTGERYLCYGGGCALNSAANARIIEQTEFEDVFVFPAAGDAGLSVGAAMYGAFTMNGKRIWIPSRHEWGGMAYLGATYTEEQCLGALERSSFHFRIPAGDLIDELVSRLADGEIVTLFRGRSEMGPRALGHRSIIADPRRVRTRDTSNLSVKDRESFRPLAPMVPAEEASRYFDTESEVRSCSRWCGYARNMCRSLELSVMKTAPPEFRPFDRRPTAFCMNCSQRSAGRLGCQCF